MKSPREICANIGITILIGAGMLWAAYYFSYPGSDFRYLVSEFSVGEATPFLIGGVIGLGLLLFFAFYVPSAIAYLMGNAVDNVTNVAKWVQQRKE
jgi:hypothetical protein